MRTKTLSDKIDYSPYSADCVFGMLDPEDVKEFIKQLKEGIGLYGVINFEQLQFIDKLAGDKLC